jgi:cellobiose transport system substrate-binding protein
MRAARSATGTRAGLRTRRGPRARLVTVMALTTAMTGAAAAACTSPAVPAATAPNKGYGPTVTLRIGVYGTSGYQQSGLYAEYEKLHPNIKIVQTAAGSEASYWQALRTHLASGTGLADIQVIPLDEISTVTSSAAASFVPLNTLGASALQGNWLPWVWQEATTASGQTLGLGADIGPMAICYRPSLLREAGLPTSRAALARQWSTWAGYVQAGQRFAAHAPAGAAFMDSAASLGNAVVSQSREQFQNSAGQPALTGNPAVTTAWRLAVQSAQAKLTARLTRLTPAWTRGLASGAFATFACPAWMLPYVQRHEGPRGAGQWDVAPAPGGTGNQGGEYLAVPRASRHQQDAFQLAAFLTGASAEATLLRADGLFPANAVAIDSVFKTTSAYFSGAPTGQIFGRAAYRMPAPILGPTGDLVRADVDAALARVAGGTATPAAAWQAVLRQAASAAGES